MKTKAFIIGLSGFCILGLCPNMLLGRGKLRQEYGLTLESNGPQRMDQIERGDLTGRLK